MSTINNNIDADDRSNVTDIEATKSSTEAPNMYLSLLDDNILEKIFGQLNLFDLLQMYDVGETFQKIIAEKVMRNRKLNVNEISDHYSVRHALKKLGRFVPAVSISQSDIQWKDDGYTVIMEIMRLIGKRCSSEHLKEITINFDEPRHKSPINFCPYMPDSMRSIESLTIIQTGSLNCDNFLEMTEFMQLQSLRLICVGTTAKFLTTLKVEKLRELAFQSCSFSNFSNCAKFFKSIPSSLRSLELSHSDPIGSYNSTFVAAIQTLQGSNWHALERLTIDEKWTPIAEFKNLNYVEIQNVFFGEHLLKAMATMGSITELCFNSGYSNYTAIKQQLIDNYVALLKTFTNLRTIKFKGHLWNWDIAVKIIRALPQVTEVHLINVVRNRKLQQAHITDLIALRDVRCLKLQVLISSFGAKFYDKLVEGRKLWHPHSAAINIYMDSDLVNNLKRTVTEYPTKSQYISLHCI